MTRALALILLAGAAVAAAAADEPPAPPLPRIPPTEPAQAEQTFRLLDGFRLELIAAEPLVTSPVAMVYDENGRAYVVEMRDYPFVGKANDKPWEDQPSPPVGRVTILEDTDGDGRFDRSTVFADHLSWPTGIALWKGGAFVAATPDVWYLKDTDGDRKADVRERVFTGFRKFNVQAVMNNLQWGLDHRIYAAGSTNGGQIRQGEGRPAVTLGRNDFRFDPAERRFELLSGGARFGNTFDDFGNRFICNIRNPVQHVVLEDRYLARNPGLPVRSAVHDAAEAGDAIPVFRISPPEPWRVLSANRLAAENRPGTPRSEMAAVGYVTSSSGVTIYRGAAYPPEFDGNAFVGEVAGNLVIRYRLEPKGATFAATRTSQGHEFLASTDNWFRPVNFVNAPDGTLHVIDMYRETIEHPWSIPDDIKARLDLESGRDRGRIYRLVPPRYRDGFQPPGRPKLGAATTDELVAQLENPNSWWRDTAHRLLFERHDRAALVPLRRLLEQSASPAARLRALCSLQGLGALAPADLQRALADASPRVREHAVRLAENALKDDALRSRVLALASDGDARVRLQVALTLGERPGPESSAALRTMARRDAADPWIRTAVLCSLPADSAADLLRSVLADRAFAATAEGQALAEPLAVLVAGRRQPAELNTAIAALLDQPGLFRDDHTHVALDSPAFGLVLAFCERLGSGGKGARELAALAGDSEKTRADQLFEAAAAAAHRADEPAATRVRAIRLLACRKPAEVADTLAGLLDVQQPHEVQLAAASALAASADPHVADVFLTRYRRLTPSVREHLITLLLARAERTERLLGAVERGEVPVGDIPPVRRSLLMRTGPPAQRARAEHLFGRETSSAERKTLIARYRAALQAGIPPDPKRGASVYQRECASCHRLGEQGHDVGPNLATIRGRTPVEIVDHVLDPNREVSPQYLEYVISTRDGQIQTGLIASETPTSLTLRRPDGAQQTLLRSQVEAITSSGKSLMPEGLEQKISPDEMRDLVAFLLGRAD